jgi:mannose-6-phosphate isomerase-like protein (cupin superfamily)
MPAEPRAEIIRELRDVSDVCISTDRDQTVCKTVEYLDKKYGVDIFANGGDRFPDNIPEKELCERLGIDMKFNVGGDKVQSSSEMVNRAWGHWNVLLSGDGYKVKEIVVNPGKELSMQRHKRRAEHWVVVSGKAHIELENMTAFTLLIDQSCYIPMKKWHQLCNNTDEVLSVIEVSTGDYIEEDDIERKSL